jgi:deoxycytidylate deaminase
MNVAMVIAERSLCDRDKVGAVVVDASNRIVDTGYNGPPRGFRAGMDDNCTNWCKRAQTVTDVPRDFGDRGIIPILTGRTLALNYEDCPSLHAEANALMFSDRRLRVDGTIYITSGVCGGCAKLIANSGLTRVVCDTTHLMPHRDSTTWFDFMRNCGLTVDEMRH